MTIADVGRLPSSAVTHPFLGAAAVSLLVHRQGTQSARAAAVRLERLAEQVAALCASSAPVIVAVVGSRPFGVAEIQRFVAEAAGVGDRPVRIAALPDDPLTAAVLAGRTGVSARRLARLPLAKGARELAGLVSEVLAPASGTLWRAAR